MIGVTELLLILFLVANLAVTIYAAYRAFSHREFYWGAGIVVAFLFNLGLIVSLVYIFVIDRRRSIAS